MKLSFIGELSVWSQLYYNLRSDLRVDYLLQLIHNAGPVSVNV